MAQTIRLGIGGIPIGDPTQDQKKPKQSTPCTAFKNTLNHQRHLNTEKFLNTEKALNTDKTIQFQSTDDILEIMRRHPDFSRVPSESHSAIVAALLSALALAGGVALTIMSGGIGSVALAPSISAVIHLVTGAALTGAGAAGIQNCVRTGIRGTFTWTAWGRDVALAAATSLIVFPATLGATCLAGSVAASAVLISGSTEAAAAFFHRSIVTAATLVNGVGQGGSDLVKQLVTTGRVDPMSLLVSLALGAWSGFSVGSQVSQLTLEAIIGDNIAELQQNLDVGSRGSGDMVEGPLNNETGGHPGGGRHQVRSATGPALARLSICLGSTVVDAFVVSREKKLCPLLTSAWTKSKPLLNMSLTKLTISAIPDA